MTSTPASTRTERIPAPGGGELDGYVWSPSRESGAGILLLQEIVGVGDYLRAVAERLCSLGYTVLAPDLFWRIERNVALDHDEAGLKRGIELVSEFDFEQGLADCEAALSHLRALPETEGRAGVLGFCLGGRLAYSVASRYHPDAAVSYYGSGIADALEESEGLRCPILLHFGTEDAYIPLEQVNKIEQALGGRDGIEVRLYRAGHAFDNHEAPMFYDPEAAREAWGVTTAFLERELPAAPKR
jgi:carboxymethylenebutenolidase